MILNQEQKIIKTQIKGYFTRLQAYNPQKCQGHDSQGKTEELVQIQGD